MFPRPRLPHLPQLPSSPSYPYSPPSPPPPSNPPLPPPPQPPSQKWRPHSHTREDQGEDKAPIDQDHEGGGGEGAEKEELDRKKRS